MTAAVFLDKDGTLVEDVPYNVDPQRIRLAPTARNALTLFARAGCPLVVVTNQSGVARGLFPEAALDGVRARLEELCDAQGARLHAFMYCPHHPEGSVAEYAVACECRKPRAGMLRRAASDLGIDLGQSWLVGDILDDIEAGNAAGCRTILVDNGHETEWRLNAARRPSLIVRDLESAARLIVAFARDPRGEAA